MGQWAPLPPPTAKPSSRLTAKLSSFFQLLLQRYQDVARIIGCTFFSKVDLREGCFLIFMHPDDIFKSPFDLFKFLRLPFGLRLTPVAIPGPDSLQPKLHDLPSQAALLLA